MHIPNNNANLFTSKGFKQTISKLNVALSAIDQQTIIITDNFNPPHINWKHDGHKQGFAGDEKHMLHILN